MEANIDTLEEVFAQTIPASLDDIIRINRDKVQAYLSTESELESLKAAVAAMPVKAKVSDWAFITLHITEAQRSLVYLVGFNQVECCTWMTSLVTGIEDHRVTTSSGSIYELTGPSTSDVDLLHICATLHHWGIGPSWGVPHIYY